MNRSTVVLLVDAREPQAAAIAQAAALIRAGRLVAFPTETVYGLGANALDAAAVEGIFRAKGRPANNQLIVHVADVASAQVLAAAWPEAADRLAKRFWPGPLSLVLPKRASVPDVVTAGAATVAVRVPAHPVALALLRAAHVPIAAPSANRSMAVSPTLAQHVLCGLDGRIDLLLDGGATSGGLESTVLDLSTTPPRLLRPGLVGQTEIEAVIGPIAAAAIHDGIHTPLPSPGMLNRHYAPRATLECAVSNSAERVRELLDLGMHVGWLSLDRTVSPARVNSTGLFRIAMPCDAAEYAAKLYAALHACDEAGVDRIVVDVPPHGSAWTAIHDRLRRASAAESAER